MISIVYFLNLSRYVKVVWSFVLCRHKCRPFFFHIPAPYNVTDREYVLTIGLRHKSKLIISKHPDNAKKPS